MSTSVTILGSTGSIGTQTLEVIKAYPNRFRVEALAAGNNLDLLIKQVLQFQPKYVSVATKELADQLKIHIPSTVKVLYGEEGLLEVAAASDADYVVNAVVGSRGLAPTLAAINAGKQIGLANKETLVTGGHIVSKAAKEKDVVIYPIDSEHSAIFQCLHGGRKQDVNKITLTASGGAFRDRTRDQLKDVTVQDALKHPNWSMGAKVTIDSATMCNKGLEVIEAHWLFDLPYEKIDVLIHQESIIHSFVEFNDHSVIAQLGVPDMKVPIQYALTYPDRLPSQTSPLNLAEIAMLHFKQMDFERFPCLRMAYDAGKAGGTAPAVFNAANEVAVERFITGEIAFTDIEIIIEHVLERHSATPFPILEEIFEADEWARDVAKALKV